MKQLSRAFGTWEFGLLVFMAVLYLVGTWINPNFFGNATALASVLRDAARFGVMAVGMSFVIINRDLDLVNVKRLFKVVKCPAAYRLNRSVYCLIAAYHHDDRVRR